MVNIVKVNITHLNDLAPLFDSYRVFYKATSDIEAAKNFLASRIKHKQSTIFMAYVDNKPAGFTQIYPSYSSVSMATVLILNDLYVDSSYRKRGVGEALLNEGKSYTKKLGAKSLILETAIDNPAQHLYERMDWMKDLEHFHYEWVNESWVN